MTLTREQEKKMLAVLAAVFAVLLVYRLTNTEKPRTAPLKYRQGAVVSSPIRGSITSPVAQADPLVVFFARKGEPFPGVPRDLFRMSNPVPKPKKPPVATALVAAPPPIPQKTPEEMAADASRAELARFRFIGYLTEKDNSVFLQKDGETFIVKRGDTIQKNFKVKEIGKDNVIIIDTVTHVEVRVELAGGAAGTEPGAGIGQRQPPGHPAGFAPPGAPPQTFPRPGMPPPAGGLPAVPAPTR